MSTLKTRITMKCIKSIVSLITAFVIVLNLSYGMFDIRTEAEDSVDEYFEAARNYYYNQLNDFEKTVFEKYGQITVENPVVTLSAEEIADYSQKEITDMCGRAYTAFITDNPKYHMIWNRYPSSVSFTEQNAVIRIETTEIYSENELKKAENRIYQIKDAVGTDGDLYTRVRKLWQFFWKNMSYNYYTFASGRVFYYNDNALGCFNRNTAICAGFADAFKIMCNELEIPCIVVGNAGHAWNFVQMDDGKWYSIDPSLSSASDEEYLQYLLIGKLDTIYLQNANYSISDLYIAKEGDFSFPVLSDYSYVYNGANTDFEATETVNEIDEYEYVVNEDGKTCTITNYSGNGSGDLIVPETIDGYIVTVIGNATFYNCRGFTGSIIIPDTVKIIDDNAFMLCCNLSGTLLLPDGLEEIRKGAFAGCKKLSGSLTLPENLAKIEYAAFYDCKSFTGDLLFPANTEIEGCAFYRCAGLNGICKLPDDESFGLSNGTLYGCNFTAYDVSENNPVYSVYDDVIYSKDLTELILCPSQKSGELKMPDTLKVIKEESCSKCKSITSVVIPQSVTSIEPSAFAYSPSIESISFDNSAVNIGESAFYECSGLTEIDLGNSVISIEDYAFVFCSSLDSIVIPDSVTDMGSRVFAQCSSLESVTVGENNTTYASNNGVLFNKDLTKLIIYPPEKEETTYAMPESVIIIEDYAFQNCLNLENVVIGNNVESIGRAAFSYCGNLKNIEIPDSVISTGSGLFQNCSSLKNITIGNNIKNIEESVFWSCTSVKSIKIGENVENIKKDAFCSCWGLTSVIIPDSVTNIGESAFRNCYDLADVYYEGTEEEWNEISIGEGNDYLLSATIHYNYTECTLSGTITSFGDDASGVTVSLLDSNGTEVISAVTEADGTYKFTAIPAGIYTLSLSKESHVTREYTVTVSTETVQDVVVNYIGDANGDGKISALDLTRIRKIILDKSADKTAYSYSCADTNNDGKVSALDLTRIRKHINKSNPLF